MADLKGRLKGKNASNDSSIPRSSLPVRDETLHLLQQDVLALNKEIRYLGRQVRKQNSFRYNFALSIVRGVGYVIGITIVATVVLAVMANIFDSLGGIGFLDQIFKFETLEQSIQNR